jgi:hypothetical protein
MWFHVKPRKARRRGADEVVRCPSLTAAVVPGNREPRRAMAGMVIESSAPPWKRSRLPGSLGT